MQSQNQHRYVHVLCMLPYTYIYTTIKFFARRIFPNGPDGRNYEFVSSSGYRIHVVGVLLNSVNFFCPNTNCLPQLIFIYPVKFQFQHGVSLSSTAKAEFISNNRSGTSDMLCFSAKTLQHTSIHCFSLFISRMTF